MSSLHDALESYLTLRRGLGSELKRPGALLHRFVEFLDREGATVVTTELALRWATEPADATSATWAQRLPDARRFLVWLSTVDSRTEVPPPGLLPDRYRRRPPYIYSDEEIERVVSEAARLPSRTGLRGHTYSTLFGLLAATGPYQALIHAAAQGDLLHNDDSSMRVLSLMEENKKLRESGQTKARTGIFVTGIVSVAEGRQIALFFTGRKHAGENLQDVLAQRVSELGPPLQMSDALDRNSPAVTETVCGNCLAHGRRKFVEIAESFPSECKHVLDQIALVYKHDKEARELALTPEERLTYHVEHSKPVVDELEKWLKAQLDEHLVEPNSSLGGAINYMLNHWEGLTLFLREPGAPLDNNVCERSLKRPILHRKNSLFYKTLNGASVGDLFMSLITTAELSGANPFEYLVALLRHAKQVESDPAAWLPWNYTEALEQAATPHGPG